MDPDEFDALVARLAQGPSRREALKGLVGGVLASVPVGASESAAREKPKRGDGNHQAKRHRKGGRDGKGSRDGNGGNDGQQGDHAGRGRQRARKRKHDRQQQRKQHDRAQARQEVDAERKKKRCKKNGKPCSGNKKCCSKFCNPQSGKCAKKPVS